MDENIIYVDAETWDWLMAELRRPPRYLPKLAALFNDYPALDS